MDVGKSIALGAVNALLARFIDKRQEKALNPR
jgi:hypothetical protein